MQYLVKKVKQFNAGAWCGDKANKRIRHACASERV